MLVSCVVHLKYMYNYYTIPETCDPECSPGYECLLYKPTGTPYCSPNCTTLNPCKELELCVIEEVFCITAPCPGFLSCVGVCNVHVCAIVLTGLWCFLVYISLPYILSVMEPIILFGHISLHLPMYVHAQAQAQWCVNACTYMYMWHNYFPLNIIINIHVHFLMFYAFIVNGH